MAERDRKPERNKVLERLCRRRGAFTGQREFPRHIVAGVRKCRDEADTRLVMPDVMPVVVAPIAVLIEKVSTTIVRSERLLNLAMAITIQAAYGLERLSR